MSKKKKFRAGESVDSAVDAEGVVRKGGNVYNVSDPQTHPIRYVPRLSEKDIERLAKVAHTEVALIFQKQGNSQEAQKMAAGVIDTILNRRIEDPSRVKSVREIANYPEAFSAITYQYKGVDNVPPLSGLDAGDDVREFTKSYIASRANGERSWIGGHTNFANHHASNLAWPRDLAAAGAESAGFGKFRHWHGTVGSTRQPVEAMFGSPAAIRLQEQVYHSKQEALGLIKRRDFDGLERYAKDATGPKAVALLDILQDSGVKVQPHDAQIDLASTFATDGARGSRAELLQEEVNKGNIYSPGRGRVYNANATISESQVERLVEQAQKVPVKTLMRQSGLYASGASKPNNATSKRNAAERQGEQNFAFLGLEKQEEREAYLNARGIDRDDKTAVSAQLKKDVGAVQAELAENGAGEADGVAGNKTQAALKQFQKENGDIPATLAQVRFGADNSFAPPLPTPKAKAPEPAVENGNADLIEQINQYLKSQEQKSGRGR
jgi:peptidoglycan hydrolase-like protein with peptidoglycan-binding domain